MSANEIEQTTDETCDALEGMAILFEQGQQDMIEDVAIDYLRDAVTRLRRLACEQVCDICRGSKVIGTTGKPCWKCTPHVCGHEGFGMTPIGYPPDICPACTGRASQDTVAVPREILEKLFEQFEQREQAYPVSVFPEADFKEIARVLGIHGMTVDRVSASNFRWMVASIGKDLEPLRQALGATK